MKKLFGTLLVCVLIAIGVYIVIYSDVISNIFVKDINIESVYINQLQLDNNTYYYSKLNDKEKRIYRVIANGVMNLNKNMTVEVTKENSYESTKENVEVALNAFFSDHPEVFYVNDQYEISVLDFVAIKMINLKLDYVSDDKKEIESMSDEMNVAIENINARLTNAKTDYEKELLIHDIIASETQYFEHNDYKDIPNIKHTAYGALVQKSAVCDGITKAFQIVLNKNNIESVFATGRTDGVAHAWCKVKLDNDYYNVDVTSDKTLDDINNKLVVHAYFNVTDKELMKSHVFDNYEKMPSATATKYNYYLYNDYTITYFDSFEYKLGQIIKSQNSKPLLEFSVSGISNVPDKIINSLYSLNFNNYKTNKITKMEYTKINDNYIIVK